MSIVVIELTVAGLFRIFTWFPINPNIVKFYAKNQLRRNSTKSYWYEEGVIVISTGIINRTKAPGQRPLSTESCSAYRPIYP